MTTNISENEMSNSEKYYNYKTQLGRLKRAMGAKFYLEAMFIEYAIMEDRTEAILRYEGNTIKLKEGDFVSIDRKLKKIMKIAEEKCSLSHKYISIDVIAEILQWKEGRNKLIHALMKQQVTPEDIYLIASTGEDLTKQLSNMATKYRRAVERRNNKSAK